MKNKTCCFCKKKVLGIFGQDDLLDSYYFKESLEDSRAISEGVYGDCHIKCLLESPWKDFWTNRRIDNLVKVRGYELIYQDVQSSIYRNGTTKEYVVLPVSHVLLFVSDKKIKIGMDECGIKVSQSELFWELPLSQSTLTIESFFDEKGGMPLVKLADIFGVADKFYDEKCAHAGKLLSIAQKTDDWLKKRVIVGDLACSISLTSEVINFLKKQL